MASVAPDDYTAGLAAVDEPLLEVVGSEDEAFIAENFEAAVRGYSSGEVIVFEGENHNSIHHGEQVIAAVAAWMAKLPRT